MSSVLAWPWLLGSLLVLLLRTRRACRRTEQGLQGLEAVIPKMYLLARVRLRSTCGSGMKISLHASGVRVVPGVRVVLLFLLLTDLTHTITAMKSSPRNRKLTAKARALISTSAELPPPGPAKTAHLTPSAMVDRPLVKEQSLSSVS